MIVMSKKIVVIGGGPAGYAAAVRASKLGGNVTLIEKDRLGGVCTNRGCIPTKAMAYIASIVENIKNSRRFGINIKEYSVDFKDIVRARDRVVKRLSMGVEHLLRENNVEIVKGVGKIVGSKIVEVNGRQIECDDIIIATGSRPVMLKIPGIENIYAKMGDDIFDLIEIPENILIVGGGAIGVEFSYIFNSLDRNVTIVELMPHILPNIDEEIALNLQKILIKSGVNIYTNTVVSKFEKSGDKAVAYLSNNEKIESDLVIISVGRVANSDGLGLEKIDVKTGRKGVILVDEHMRTSVENIYAAGDVAGKYFLAYTAYSEGIVAAENAMGLDTKINYKSVPIAIFSEPEVASVGLNEKEAREKFGEIKVGRAPFIINGRALAMNMYNGFIKVIVNKNNKIIGIHMLGPYVSELIHEAALILNNNLKIEDLAEGTLYIHPSLSETLKEAALACLNKAIHV